MANDLFIPVNRKRLILLTLVYSVVGLVAFLCLYYLGEAQSLIPPVVFKTASVIVLLFFVIITGTYARNLRNKEAGLYISNTGIDDQTSSISIGLVKWKDIKEIEKIKSRTSSYLIIKVKKPQHFIENAKNAAIKRLLVQNNTIYKTPVVINVKNLDTTQQELEEKLEKFVGRFSGKK